MDQLPDLLVVLTPLVKRGDVPKVEVLLAPAQGGVKKWPSTVSAPAFQRRVAAQKPRPPTRNGLVKFTAFLRQALTQLRPAFCLVRFHRSLGSAGHERTHTAVLVFRPDGTVEFFDCCGWAGPGLEHSLPERRGKTATHKQTDGLMFYEVQRLERALRGFIEAVGDEMAHQLKSADLRPLKFMPMMHYACYRTLLDPEKATCAQAVLYAHLRCRHVDEKAQTTYKRFIAQFRGLEDKIKGRQPRHLNPAITLTLHHRHQRSSPAKKRKSSQKKKRKSPVKKRQW